LDDTFEFFSVFFLIDNDKCSTLKSLNVIFCLNDKSNCRLGLGLLYLMSLSTILYFFTLKFVFLKHTAMLNIHIIRDCRGCDYMVVGFTTTYASLSPLSL
jgi:hypothetical protein